MISVFFGFDDTSIPNVDLYFNNTYEEEWFNDPMVKAIVKDIDDTDIVSPECAMSKYLGQIPVTRISGGAKCLILMLKETDLPPIDLAYCGDNCEKWVVEISKIRDIKVSMSGYDMTFDGYEISGICENDGSIIKSSEDWKDKMLTFVEKGVR